MSEVAEKLGCDWRTVNREIVRWGDALFWRKGRWKTKQWCTSVVDVGGRQLSGHSAW